MRLLDRTRRCGGRGGREELPGGGACARKGAWRRAPFSCPQLLAPDEPQPRPDGVDRADLVVDEAEWEGHLADDVLAHVGGDARAPLRPRDPERAAGEDGAAERREPALEYAALRHEEDDDRSHVRVVLEGCPGRQRPDQLARVLGGLHETDAIAFADPEL